MSADATPLPPPEPSIDDYTIGWICALQEEFEAACRMLDYELKGPATAAMNDDNTYTFGAINGHNIVIGCLAAGQYGESSATSVAKDMVRSFTKVRFALMVGIGGGAPTEINDIRLGDVVVSQPSGQHGGVLQYDFVKRLKLPNGQPDYQQIGQLSAPPKVLLGALPIIKRQYNDPRKPDNIASHLKRMEDMPEYYNRPTEDHLYVSGFTHQGGKDCKKCEKSQSKARPERHTRRIVQVHYGTIGTANSLMKHVDERDQYAKDLGILCFEMEAGGLMNTWPCLVIRGICDYCDSHKNDEWHKYAALAAAAYARELICVLKPVTVNSVAPWSEEIKRGITEIHNQVTIDSIKTDVIFQHVLTEQQEAMLNWLTTFNHTVEHNRYITTRQEGTGNWFLNSKQYRSWLASSNRFLFCPGIPGAGKSVLTSIAIEDLISQFTGDSRIAVTYLYLNSRQKDEQKIENLLGSLLSQFIRLNPSLLDEVQPLFEVQYKAKGRPSRQQISEALNLVAHSFSKAFVIVDALDECTTTDGCRAKLLSELSDLQKVSAVHMLATSRLIPDIISSFPHAERFDIRADIADVELFLESHITELPHRAHRSKEIQEEIKLGISEAVDGMFLLAKMYLNLLSHKLTHNDIRRQLAIFKKQTRSSRDDEMVITLAKAYEKTMESIEDRGEAEKALAMEALSWVTYKIRDLTILELQYAIAVKCGEAHVDEGDIPFPEDIIAICAGLITVDAKTNTVHLAHHTTQEYLMRTKDKWFPGVRLKLARTCIGYVSSNEIFANSSGWCDTEDELQTRLRSYPLYTYASLSWAYYAKLVISDVHTSILDLVRDPVKMVASNQAILPQILSLDIEITETFTRSFTALHVAALFGLEIIVGTLIENGHHLDPMDSAGRTPLSYAVIEGHAQTVLELLERGHPRDKKDIFGRTPLFYAAGAGNESVVKLLLDKPQRNEKGILPSILNKLLPSNCGVDINSTDLENYTPILYATALGLETTVETLLSYYEIDANIPDKNGRVPLWWAMTANHGNLIRLLSNWHRIDSNMVEHMGLSLLHGAVLMQRVNAVQLLLNCNGNDPNVFNNDGSTPLTLAVHMAVTAVQKRTSDDDILTEQHLPVSGDIQQAEEIVKVLAEFKKTDPNLKNGRGQTPLLLAVEGGTEVIVKALLACKLIDPNMAGEDGTTPLFQAIWDQNEVIIQLLLSSPRIDPNTPDKHGITPLLFAIQRRLTSVVILLLKCRSINPNAAHLDGTTPLHLATTRSLQDITRLLLDHDDINPNVSHDIIGTPLLVAVCCQNEEIVKLLSDRDDIDVSIANGIGYTPWECARLMDNHRIKEMIENRHLSGVD